MAEWIADWLLPWILPPGGFVTLLFAAVALRAVGFRRLALAAVILCGLSLWLVSTSSFSRWLSEPLELRYAYVAPADAPAADAILVLGGGTQPSRVAAAAPDLNEGSDRVFMAAALFDAGRAPLVVVSGGQKRTAWPHTEAGAMRFYLERWGVPPERIIEEAESGSTRENCERSARIFAARGVRTVLLVTSALHMHRSLAVCRAAGIDALPVPTDHGAARVAEPRPGRALRPSATALAASTIALKEYLALAADAWDGE